MRSNYILETIVNEKELVLESCANNTYVNKVPESEKDFVSAGLCISDESK